MDGSVVRGGVLDKVPTRFRASRVCTTWVCFVFGVVRARTSENPFSLFGFRRENLYCLVIFVVRPGASASQFVIFVRNSLLVCTRVRMIRLEWVRRVAIFICLRQGGVPKYGFRYLVAFGGFCGFVFLVHVLPPISNTCGTRFLLMSLLFVLFTRGKDCVHLIPQGGEGDDEIQGQFQVKAQVFATALMDVGVICVRWPTNQTFATATRPSRVDDPYPFARERVGESPLSVPTFFHGVRPGANVVTISSGVDRHGIRFASSLIITQERCVRIRRVRAQGI